MLHGKYKNVPVFPSYVFISKIFLEFVAYIVCASARCLCEFDGSVKRGCSKGWQELLLFLGVARMVTPYGVCHSGIV